jgi:uncharacterized membrane protein YesL
MRVPMIIAGPDQVLMLSLKQTLQRLPIWIRINAWVLALSLPIITWPAAQAGLYHAVRASLLDPFDQKTTVRESFLRGFNQYFVHSLLIVFLNALVVGLGLGALIFWTTREEPALRLFAIVTISFLFVWWLVQVFIFPVQAENPSASLGEIYRYTFRLVLSQPVYAVVISLLNATLFLVQVLLLGPSLLFVPTLTALISIQGLWGMTGSEIPDLVDPVVYANSKAARRSSSGKEEIETRNKRAS